MSTRASRGPRTVRFGEFELDARSGELQRGGDRIRLQEQPFRILLMLVERPGEVVLRDEIRKRLWPNDTVVEIGHGINAAVLRLREALGESAENPRFIETVARRGYRFRGDPAAAPPPAAPAGHYRVGDRLGAGGMGVVYRAEDLRLGREVALKVLPRELAADSAALARFHREARAASALTHPNICTIYGVEEHEGRPAIAMELLEGETLETILARGPLPAARALTLALPIAAALEAAHRKGIAHRDLKPANILLTPAGIKVLDFGLAKAERPAPIETRVTENGAILGTLHYMSPEQAQGHDAGTASDIFSFGVLLYEMIAGRRPFDGENSATVMASILKSDAAPIKPARLWRIVERCLAKEPDRRPAAGEVKTALEAVQLRPAPLVTRRRALVAALAAALIVAFPLVTPSPKPPIPKVFTIPNAGKAAVSPDGSRVAYRSGGVLFVRAVNEPAARVIDASGADPNNTPFWSPDSRSLAWISSRQLRTANVDTGETRILGAVDTTLAGAWGPDGTILIGLLGEGIFRIPATGGAFTRVTTVDARNETRHMLPQFLPGGRRFLYTAGGARPGESVLYAASLDAPERTAIVPAGSNAQFVSSRLGSSQGYLFYAVDGTLVAAPFDSSALRVTGAPTEIARSVAATATIGSAARLADFAASPATIAWRSARLLTVERNWMTALRR